MTHNTTVLYTLTCLECTKSYTGHQTDHWKISKERYIQCVHVHNTHKFHALFHAQSEQSALVW